MDAELRTRLTIDVDRRAISSRPRIAVQQHTLRPGRGLAPLDALIAHPDRPQGVLIYFPGFNTPLGPWEIAKCQYLAAATSLSVVITEIPGMSRFHDPIPRAVRADLLKQHSDSWAELNLTYVAEALRVGEIERTDLMQVLGFSTGCSLAMSALPQLATWGPIEGLNLVEPVAIAPRNLASVGLHNIADLSRMPAALATNRDHDWVMSARRRQSREPSVRYSPIDLLAIATVLSGEELRGKLDRVSLQRCALVRGSRSSLCRLPDFEDLHQSLVRRGIPGPTITVPGLGHQLWHSFPVLVRLVEAMLCPTGRSAEPGNTDD